MIERLVVNGCSYMDAYVEGGGHIDLAKKLNIESAESLAQSGCNNSRILRTCLKDSYITDKKTLYVLGMTFINRSEVPILKCEDEHTSFEGRWTNPQNQLFENQWEDYWTDDDTQKLVNLKLKEALYGLLDLTEDLMYRIISVITDLENRGHKVLIYQQADKSYWYFIDYARLQLFKTKKNIVNGFHWCSIIWQHEQGVPYMPGDYKNRYETTPEEMRHRLSGEHVLLNRFLTNYIEEHKILE